MGMDYCWSGSASYPRFDRELCAVAEIFGGIKTEHLKEREATEKTEILAARRQAGCREGFFPPLAKREWCR